MSRPADPSPLSRPSAPRWVCGSLQDRLTASERRALAPSLRRLSSDELLAFLRARPAHRRRALAPSALTILLPASSSDASPVLHWLESEHDVQVMVCVVDTLYSHLLSGGPCGLRPGYELDTVLPNRALQRRFLLSLPQRTRTRFLRLVPRDTLRLLLTIDHRLLAPGDGEALATSFLSQPFPPGRHGFLTNDRLGALLATPLPPVSLHPSPYRFFEGEAFTSALIAALPVSSWFRPPSPNTVRLVSAPQHHLFSTLLEQLECAQCCPAQRRAVSDLTYALAPEWDKDAASLVSTAHTALCSRP